MESESDTQYQTQQSLNQTDNQSMGASSYNNMGGYVQKKFQIELNIKLLYVSDPKYFNQPFKIYWTRGKKKIDTRKAIVKPETQIAKFNDKFSMKTVLQWDEEGQEFKAKPVCNNLFFISFINMFIHSPYSKFSSLKTQLTKLSLKMPFPKIRLPR